MAKKSLIPLSLFFLLLFLFLSMAGCSRVDVHYAVLEGNYRYSRGEFQEAVWSYLRASESEIWEERIRYNLGNVYHRLGEDTGALQEWERAETGAGQEIAFRVFFNRGVLYYEQGEFLKSYEAFRKALEIESASVDAKINLEHALRKVNRQRQETQTESADGGGSPEGEPQRILEYIRRNESRSWSSSPRPDSDKEGKQW
jgi:tetratricopeptide (TPR) repeat protein